MQSRVSAVARDEGLKFRVCGNVARLIERIGEETVATIFVDLQTPGLILEELASAIGGEDFPQTIAFAQHVEEQLLADARIDGIDSVMTRGQFSRELPRLIRSANSG